MNTAPRTLRRRKETIQAIEWTGENAEIIAEWLGDLAYRYVGRQLWIEFSDDLTGIFVKGEILITQDGNYIGSYPSWSDLNETYEPVTAAPTFGAAAQLHEPCSQCGEYIPVMTNHYCSKSRFRPIDRFSGEDMITQERSPLSNDDPDAAWRNELTETDTRWADVGDMLILRTRSDVTNVTSAHGTWHRISDDQWECSTVVQAGDHLITQTIQESNSSSEDAKGWVTQVDHDILAEVYGDIDPALEKWLVEVLMDEEIEWPTRNLGPYEEGVQQGFFEAIRQFRNAIAAHSPFTDTVPRKDIVNAENARDVFREERDELIEKKGALETLLAEKVEELDACITFWKACEVERNEARDQLEAADLRLFDLRVKVKEYVPLLHSPGSRNDLLAILGEGPESCEHDFDLRPNDNKTYPCKKRCGYHLTHDGVKKI